MSDHQFAFLTSTTHPGFLNAPPLAGRPGAEVVVAGVAWDGATTNRPGARLGPFAIRRASHMFTSVTAAVSRTPAETCAGWRARSK